MGTSVRTLSTAQHSRPFPLVRAANFVLGATLLVLAVPLIAVLALLVRQSSSGPVLRRERTRDRYGRPTEVLSFRTTIDGGNTDHHERMRAIVGASDHSPETVVGRFMLATRLDLLPRLFSVVCGHASLI